MTHPDSLQASLDPTYSLRYLTGRALFLWQLRDPSHRRRLLFQALVFLQYLEMPKPPAARKAGEKKDDGKQFALK